MFPVAWLHPYEENILDKVRNCVERGVVAFKFIPNNYHVYDSKPTEVFRLIEELGYPIMFHSGVLYDFMKSSQYNQPVNWESFVDYKNLRFSMAHCAHPWYAEAMLVCGKFRWINWHMNQIAQGNPDIYTDNPWVQAHLKDTEQGRTYDAPQLFLDTTPGAHGVYRKDLLQKCFSSQKGGRVRFKTDSPFIALSVKMYAGQMSHCALTGSSGFDLYINEGDGENFFGTFIPPFEATRGYESRLELGDSISRDITIHFPTYSIVEEVHIGLAENAGLAEATPYAYDKPIVFYGHSITQGACASRPGNAYTNAISRRFHIDHINLGFSGNAKGEPEMAEYVAAMDMEIFVYDYDHNAPNKEHLQNTHQRFFEILREKKPDVPVIMMTSTTMPRFSDDPEARKQIVYKTYTDALANGDKNVYFIDGSKAMEPCGDSGTVEGCHPNDLGFYFIAKAVGDVIAEILDK